jgi:hypothetical protein
MVEKMLRLARMIRYINRILKEKMNSTPFSKYPCMSWYISTWPSFSNRCLPTCGEYQGDPHPLWECVQPAYTISKRVWSHRFAMRTRSGKQSNTSCHVRLNSSHAPNQSLPVYKLPKAMLHTFVGMSMITNQLPGWKASLMTKAGWMVRWSQGGVNGDSHLSNH